MFISLRCRNMISMYKTRVLLESAELASFFLCLLSLSYEITNKNDLYYDSGLQLFPRCSLPERGAVIPPW